MNYKRLAEIVANYDLTIDVERLVTGARHVGFFQFEIVGDLDNLRAALRDIQQEWTVCSDFCRIRSSDLDGTPYLLVDSFYDDSRPITGTLTPCP